MKLKFILGIIVPIVLIIFLVILGTWPSGFNINESFEQNIDYGEIFTQSYSNNAFRIGQVDITNDYFLPKRVDAPIFLACLYDSESVRPLTSAGYVFYNEGEYSPDVEVLDLAKSSELSYYRPYSYRNRNSKINVEVPSHSIKRLQVYYTSQNYYYSYNKNLNVNLDYDQLLLLKVKNNNPSSCEQSTSEDLSNAIRMQINKKANTCYDTDDQYSYEDFSSQVRTRGTCTQIVNTVTSSYTDYCTGQNTLNEYTCSTNNVCEVQIIQCPSGCTSGRCSNY